MKHEYISLGSACDAAMILDKIKFRKNAYPFDWLWNLESGIENVIDIISSDFKNIVSENSYIQTRHYRLPNPVVVYKEYPTVIHMHSNPMINKKDHYTLLRRIQRFQEVMKSQTRIHFIYYRNHYEDTLVNPKVTVSDSLHRLVKEGEDFLRMLDTKYEKRHTDSSLLLILETNIEQFHVSNETILSKDSRIQIGYTLSRYDDQKKLYRLWQKQWIQNILHKTDCPKIMVLKWFFVKPIITAQVIAKKILKNY